MIGIIIGGESEERSDFRPVPRSDRGNDGYHDRGALGGYSTNDGEPWPTLPRGATFAGQPAGDLGYGCQFEDAQRGFCDVLITEHPAYDLANYKDRASQPRESDVTPGNVEAMPDDWAFRNRNRRTEGFLTRPRIPTERG